MKVLTIIVTYNGMDWIDKCLKSIVGQSEVVVVDNNSSDDTVTYIETNFPSVKLLSQTTNYGFGIANNIGINYALQNEADAVFLLNQDAFAQTDCIKKLITAYQQNSYYGIISPIHLNGNGSAVDYSFLKIVSPFNASSLVSDLIVGCYSKDIYEIYFINAAAWFIPKDVFYKVGGFDPLFFLYGEDDNYCQRVLFHGFKIGIIPNAIIYHDSNNSNYQIGEAGSEKYFRQFLNSVYVKYANINTDNHKQLFNFKVYMLKKVIFKVIAFEIEKAKSLFEKYRKVDVSAIKKSVMRNKIKGSNYLEI
ncbi:glycosyltransferase family 2 protein [Flavobacterium xinjiangense]|uniref:Glycosyltransferase, GT2 family n=1 Tax=Flavobacterium xinjiangense TaxID=178356 RepID=A0A1M7MVV5_9FLAO|nr:glycosyltransferase family 2 protein [Flavobacterium xinjiangense]SHM95167.1 Glycosyltransferase, GT2 family [Flavobacterium xinjiangense]